MDNGLLLINNMVHSISINLLVFVVFVMLNLPVTVAQNNTMDYQIEHLKKLSRDSLINLAIDLIDQPIQKENFDITVMANQSDMVVSFRTPIKFVPQQSIHYYDIGVILTSNQTSYNSVANPQDFLSKNQTSIFLPTEEGTKHINFVIAAINESNEVGAVDRENFKDNMVIRDQDEFYDVLVISSNQESWYKIDKAKGNVFDYGHAHFAAYPFVEEELPDPYIEIKE